MKTIVTYFLIFLIGAFAACNRESKKDELQKIEPIDEVVKNDSSKQMNLLDEQTKLFGKIFELAGAGKDNPLSGATDYAELIEKMDLPEEQKEILRDQYKIYNLSLDPQKKDSLKMMVKKLMTEAIEKSKNQQ